MQIGIWCPDASILCVACNNARAGSSHWARLMSPADIDDGTETFCDACKASVALPSFDIASLHNLTRTIEGAAMEQTGGMCHALVITRGTTHVVVTDDEDANEDASGGFYAVGLYTNDAWLESAESDDMETSVALADLPAAIEAMFARAGR